jgi:TonB-dependent SusC/RagA subfamily outer membrane receptor
MMAAGTMFINTATAQDMQMRSDGGGYIADESQGEKSPPRKTGTVSLTVRDSSIRWAITTIARQAGLRPIFNEGDPQLDKKISVKIANVRALEAFSIVLANTRLEAKLGPDGETILIRPKVAPSAEGQSQATGTVAGNVIDSTTKAGLGQVTVVLLGTRLTTITSERGDFVIDKVPPGRYTISLRSLGYTTTTREVMVTESQRTTITIAMVESPTSLTEVVTTATGNQARYQVGTAITSINVDELRKTVPVKNLTDVLDAGYISGLYVSRGSGTPGAPSRVRSRGIGSINASNDPIIIVDGVRVYSEQTTNTNDANYSVLDRIDINMVDRIDVLRGAAASAQYGSDAANGVIVITTKRGGVERTRWTLRATQDITHQPWRPTDSYIRLGTNPAGGVPDVCTLGIPDCDFYALEVFNLLGGSRTSVLGRGERSSVNASVLGGSRALSYSLGGSISREIGQIRMNDIDRALVSQFMGKDVPRWASRPQQFRNTSGFSTVQFNPSKTLTISLTNTIYRALRQETPYKDAYGLQQLATAKDSALTINLIRDYRRRTTYNEWSSLNTISSTWLPTNYLNFAGNIGYQVISNATKTVLRRGDCPALTETSTECPDNIGRLSSMDMGRRVGSINLRGTTRVPTFLGIDLTPMFGANYVMEATTDRRVTASDLMEGTSSANGAGNVSMGDTEGDKRSLGLIANLGISLFNKRIFTQVGTRIDASSVLGAEVHPVYPKLDLSYVMSDEYWMPASISTMRLRFAYGHSARQPSAGATSHHYLPQDAVLGGTVFPALIFYSIGNPILRPERSKEFEVGFDGGVFNDRITLSLTRYLKRSKDMLVTRRLPNSLGSWAWTANLGSVSNRGLEGEVSVRILESYPISWSILANLSTYRNRLDHIASDFNQDFQGDLSITDWKGQRYVVGYPIDGWWMRPVITYEDIDQDGVITNDEILRADSSIFIGSPTPKAQSMISSQVGFWGGRLLLSVTSQLTRGMIQGNLLNANSLHRAVNPIRELNDPSTPLARQALIRSGYHYLHPVSMFRISAVSASIEAPQSLTRMFRSTAMRIQLTGDNVGLWTNYSGADPNVNETIVGSRNRDSGQLPMPRRWGINVLLSY